MSGNGTAATAAGNELHLAQAEIRQLKATVAALRSGMEELQAGRDAAIQAAVAGCRDEVTQLQRTVLALREELERLRFEHADQLERQRQAAEDDLRQLRENVVALRVEMERARGR